jgi:hypothetical protein
MKKIINWIIWIGIIFVAGFVARKRMLTSGKQAEVGRKVSKKIVARAKEATVNHQEVIEETKKEVEDLTRREVIEDFKKRFGLSPTSNSS